MTDTLGSRVTGTKNVAIRSHTRLRLLSQLRTVALEVMAMPPSKNYNIVPSQQACLYFFTLLIFFNVLLLQKGGRLLPNPLHLKSALCATFAKYELWKSRP